MSVHEQERVGLDPHEMLRHMRERADFIIENQARRTRRYKFRPTQYDEIELRAAGVIEYLTDRLVELGHDRTFVSDNYGFGYLHREDQRRNGAC